jgi:GTP:adenosylcobinamide-phosphate guanylyltransferase
MKFENEDPFFNINTKDDFKKAMEKLEKWLVISIQKKF